MASSDIKVEKNPDSGSDFDDDDDPDKIEVPGGGKDLATAANIKSSFKDEKPSSTSINTNNLSKPLESTYKVNSNNMGYSKVMGGMSNNWMGSMMNNPFVNMAQGTSNMMFAQNMPYPGMIPPSINPNQFLQGMGGGGGMMDANAATNFLYQLISSGGSNAAMISQLLNSGNPAANLFLQNLLQQPTFPQQGFPMNPKNLNPYWYNQSVNNKMANNRTTEEEEDNEDDDMGVAETYADYMPAKLKLGKKHPDPVVETASLSSVEPADVKYELSIPMDTINSGSLSALQLEAITYTCQQHEHILPDGSRAGFLIGDGAGVGKGRTIAGLIYENFLKGRKKAIWVSVSNDLKYDAERDLEDIGTKNIKVYSLNKFKYAKINSPTNGNVSKGVIFSTYSALIGESSGGGKYKSRLKQILNWCGDHFDGVIVFDECHRAKNLCPVGSTKPTKTGLTVLELQNKLPKARVVYASATGASEPRNMAYMVRLGMWGQGTTFPEFLDFINAVEKRGVGAMEIVAMDMKLRGMYIARQLSFHGVTFKIEEVPLSPEFTNVYDSAVKLWVDAMHMFQEAAELIDAENRMRKTMWGQFWSSHQRFFKYLCIAAKVKHAVEVAREAIKHGKCVIIGLQSTGEARTLEQLEKDDGELTDFVSTAKGVLQSLVEKHFPAPDRSRIKKLLGSVGIELKQSKPQNGDSLGPSSSKGIGEKRKSGRQANSRPNKRTKESSESESKSDNDDSDFKMESESESEISEEHSEDSEASSDFNPFNEDESDSDEPWVGAGRAKKRKIKTPAQKKPTTKDKIHQIVLKSSMSNNSQHKDAIDRACSMKEELIERIERLGDKLPPNTLDQLIDELGGPENVAEMTGRKGRVVQTDGGIQYESRSEADAPLETLNVIEKQRFMDGEKDVAIISEAASSGISLQSDRRARNQRRRVHITLELPWSADRAIQQFGRSHRSNQVNAPEYIFLISDLAGERRFASIVAKRLESLGALTHGDRRATETRDLSKFNIDNKYGRAALETTMKTIIGYESPIVPPPSDYKGNFFEDVGGALVGVGLIINNETSPGNLTLDKDYNNISKFLNRILGMPVELQNRLFKYFTDVLHHIITQAKKSGRFDLGILDLGTAGENVKRVKLYSFLRKHATGQATTELHIVHVERGMSWDEAVERSTEAKGSNEGFYLSHQIRNNKSTAVLAIMADNNSNKKSENTKTLKKDIMFMLFRPNTGLQLRQESLSELEKKYYKVGTDKAEKHWKEQYESSENVCSHAYWRGNCKLVTVGQDCEVGLRRRTYNVLSGSVLSVWSRIENVLLARTGSHHKMQVVRLKTAEGVKIVGTLIPKSCVEALKQDLSSDAEKTEEIIT
ncbi:protein strawberry notch [Daktulosphaira vitifoliae]|uniref:protein strawberry notch n=1 Tax=Daktulosphaira vitifoliae TaxID=58002 RepID=UPI0021AA7C02|nr:protein strawberry notch [Daktulosphaira vitifoliae]